MLTDISLPVDALLLLGPTGVGKSPLGALIAHRGLLGRRCHHMDFGSELRRIDQAPLSSSYSTAERDFIHNVLERGLLLENEHFTLARKIITDFLLRSSFYSGDILVLNGIPRHAGQASDISTIANILALIVLDCPPDAVYCRLRDNVGGDRTERNDDTKELVAKKLHLFTERTAPLIRHYTETSSKIYHVPVTDTSTTDQAYEHLSSLAASDPPIAFITEPPHR